MLKYDFAAQLHAQTTEAFEANIVFSDFSSDEAIANILLSKGSKGIIRTDTMKAFTEDQFRNILTKVQ